MSNTDQPSIDYSSITADLGLVLDNDRVQSDVNAKITLELVNTQTHRIPLEKGQSADSLYGLLKSIAVDGAATYDFSSRATVQPDNTVTIKLDKDVLKAHFKNMMGEEDVFTLVPRPKVQKFSGSGLFLTRSNLRSGFNTTIFVTIAEVGPGREFTIEAGRALESVTGVFETLKFVVGVQSWEFGSSYDVEQDSGVLVKYNEDEVPTAHFTDAQGAKQAVALIPLFVEPGPDA